MTKKDFIALADALRRTKPLSDEYQRQHSTAEAERYGQWNRDVNAIHDVLKASNPRFKDKRWFDYVNGECGPNGGKVAA